MNFIELEKAVYGEFTKKFFDNALTRLIDKLMWASTNNQSAPNGDRIFFVSEDWKENEFEGAGSIWSLGRFEAVPLKASMQFEADVGILKAAEFKIGACSLTKEWTKEKIEKKFLKDPRFEFDWMRIFELPENGWIAVAPELKE